jgi:hydroxylysine kinase
MVALHHPSSESSRRLAELGLADGGALGAGHTVMTEEEARGIAAALWGLDVDARRFATEKDDTFRLDGGESGSYILKVANPHEPRAVIEFETALMMHVADSAHDVPVSRVIATQNGEDLARVHDRAGQARMARLLTFLEGTPLDATTSTAVERERVGRHAPSRTGPAAQSRRGPASPHDAPAWPGAVQ